MKCSSDDRPNKTGRQAIQLVNTSMFRQYRAHLQLLAPDNFSARQPCRCKHRKTRLPSPCLQEYAKIRLNLQLWHHRANRPHHRSSWKMSYPRQRISAPMNECQITTDVTTDSFAVTPPARPPNVELPMRSGDTSSNFTPVVELSMMIAGSIK